MLSVCALFGAIAFGVSRKEPIPFLDRNRYTVFSPEMEGKIGDMIAKAFLLANQNDVVDPNDPIVKHITEVGNHLCKANGLPPHRYFLIDSPIPNAFVLPGRTVFIYSGILPIFANQSGAAMVIGHEIGHVLAGHSYESLFFLIPASALIYLMMGSMGTSLMSYFLTLPRSRWSELEADKIGLHLMTGACFDVSEGEKVFQRLCDSTGGDQEVDLFTTHPTWAKRTAQLNELSKTDKIQNFACACGDIEYNWPGYKYFSQLRLDTHQFSKITDSQLEHAFTSNVTPATHSVIPTLHFTDAE